MGLSAGTVPLAPEDVPLTVLLVHNYYQQPGGEDRVFDVEGAMLEQRGHRVLRYIRRNDEVEDMNRAALAANTLWSRASYRDVLEIVEREGVDVVHVHNTLPLASPSVYYAAHAGGAAVVQTLHNYRLICPGSLLLRDGAICHKCVGRSVALPAVQHACYRDSRAATAAVATTTALHRAAGTYREAVDRYIVLSEFARDLFVQGGLPGDRLAVKPNSLQGDPTPGPGGDYALFAGRLAEGKGLQILIDAWASDLTLPALKIAGDGDLAHLAEAAAASDPRITWLGWTASEEMQRLIGHAACLITPSTWYEGWPVVTVEAMGLGTPIIATDHGVFPEVIEDGVTGHLFPRGNVAALASGVHKVMGDPVRLSAMREQSYTRFQTRFARSVNYQRLRSIYAEAIDQRVSDR